MGTRKKGSELVFNIQWKSKPEANIIGMYDTPATTLNFETFKSYLLKNSGVAEKDVKVIYLTDNGVQWVIDSQEWFEIALCAFRLKARLGEIIFLKLETVSTSLHQHQQMAKKYSNDVETQFDHSIPNSLDNPPEWFLAYMSQFKKEIVKEVTFAVSSNITNNKEKETTPPVVVFPKKMKPESSKRSRKHLVLGETPIDKELLKTLKFDRKIESKLDKLDAKTKKIKEKKQALINKIDSEEYRHQRRPQILLDLDTTPLMNASVCGPITAAHMVGGETYLHTWEVKNNGQLPWTSKTELRLTWGSADLKPSVNAVRCPPLLPGEKGTLAVRFQIPKKPGQYESYWNFYDNHMRFGHGLSCAVCVDPPISYIGENGSSKKPKIEEEHQQNVFSEKKVITPEEPQLARQILPQNNCFINYPPGFDVEGAAAGVSGSVIDLSRRMQEIKIVGPPHVDSDSDWESLGSFGRARKCKNIEDNLDDFDPVKTNKYGINEKDLIVDLSKSKIPTSPVQEGSNEVKEEAKTIKEENSNSNDDNNNGISVNNNSSGESICENVSEASDLSSGYDIINAPVCDEKEESSGYVYITVDGNKLPVPKHILRPDFLESAEEAPGPLNSEDEEKSMTSNKKEHVPEKLPAESFVKSENPVPEEQINTQPFIDMMQNMKPDAFADAKSGQHTRVFVFPQDNPGFEFLYYPKGLGERDNGPCPNFAKVSIFEGGVKDTQSEPPMKTEESTTQKASSPKKEEACKEEEVTPPVNPVSPNLNPENAGVTEKTSIPPNNIEYVALDPLYGCDAYTWAQSETQYTFPDLQSACAAAHLRCDPYGPLEQSRPTSSQSGSTGAAQFQHVPNYQQSTPEPACFRLRQKTAGPKPACFQFKQETQGQKPGYFQFKQETPTAPPPQPVHSPVQPTVPQVHILPENLVSGAVNVASSAINTARSVISMIVPPKVEAGKWVNGHWVTENAESTRAKNLCVLAEMGFWDQDLNATLLARYNDDVAKVVSELLQQ